MLIALGHISVAVSGILGKPVFFLGLVLIVMGTGLLKPNISAIVGDLYPDKGARRDAGFSIFYMGINLGATLGPLVTGFLRNQAGYHYGFGAAGVGMLAGVITYRLRSPSTLGTVGMRATGTPEQQRTVKLIVAAFAAAVIAVIALATTGVISINAKAVAHNMVYLEVGMAALYFAYLFFFAKLTSDEMKRVAVIVVLFVFAAIFWSGFEQAPSSLNLFAKDFTEPQPLRLRGAVRVAAGREFLLRRRARSGVRVGMDVARRARRHALESLRSSPPDCSSPDSAS